MGIDIKVIAGPDGKSSDVKATGSIQHVITNDERGTFKLSDSELKSAVNAYFGQSPTDAYLSSPTPWGDLYKTYSWPQVQTVLVVSSAQVLGVSSQPVIVKTQEFANNSSKKATFNVAVSESVEDTVTSSWNTGGTLSISQSISVGVDFIVKGTVKDTLSYSQDWNVGGSKSKTVTVGSESGASIELKPGQAIEAKLSASRGVLKVRVFYNAYLIGNTAVNYDKGYKGHHFWSLPIKDVMAKAKINNSVKSTQDIEIGYYSNSKVDLFDKKSGKAIY